MRCAGLAFQARRRFGRAAQRVPIDTTSFSVSGEAASKEEEGDPVPRAITSGSSHDHREDLKPWMRALREGTAVCRRERGNDPGTHRCLKGLDSEPWRLQQSQEDERQRGPIWWIRRVPATSTAAQRAWEQEPEQWHVHSDGSGEDMVHTLKLSPGKQRWVIVRTHAQRHATLEQMERKGKKSRHAWEKRLWHISTRACGCPTDARTAWEQALKGTPSWLMATCPLHEPLQDEQRGCPKKGPRPITRPGLSFPP